MYYLLGASGHAKVVIDILHCNNERIAGLFDKDETINELLGYSVINPSFIEDSHNLIITIGDNSIRKKLASQFQSNSYKKAIHPQAVLANEVDIGEGTVIMASATINSNAKIGRHVIINTSASVDHDCEIADCVHIAPNATLCGGISIGEGTLIGAGAVVLPNVRIGQWCVIGAGSVVNIDLPDNCLAVGNPVRIVR